MTADSVTHSMSMENPSVDSAAPHPTGLTFRALALGCFFASVNSTVNMYFNFRYAGGLGQYWVIIVSYVLMKYFDKLAAAWGWTHIAPFGAKEHTIVTLTGTAAAFAQSLGLSGGLAPLTLYFGEQFSLAKLFGWTFVAAFFGIFVGILYQHRLVLNNLYPWPVARMNAETIAAFHGIVPGKPMEDEATRERNAAAALRIFSIFTAVVLPWYIIANTWLRWLVTMPFLCWICRSLTCQVLGEGYTGVGLPGMTLGPSIALGWNATIVDLEVTLWLAVGAVLNFWVLAPSLYLSGETIWPGGLNLFDQAGNPYTPQSKGPVQLSSTLWLTMLGINFTLFGQIVESILVIFFPEKDELEGEGTGSTRSSSFSLGGAAPSSLLSGKDTPVLTAPLEKRHRTRTGSGSSEDDLKHSLIAGESVVSRGKRSMSIDPDGQVDFAIDYSSLQGTVPTWVGAAGVGLLAVAFVIIIQLYDMKMPWWGSVVTVCFSVLMTYGLGLLMGTAAQNMALPSSMVLQLFFGFLLPGKGQPNIVSAAINNAIVAQTLTLLNDYKTAVLLGVQPRHMMAAQCVGTFVGTIWSVLVYYTILNWNAIGRITLGQGVWANLGAEGSHLLASLFGEIGLARIFHDNPRYAVFALVCMVIGLLGPIIRRRIPKAKRAWFPNTVLIGLAQFPPALAFSVVSGLALGLFYQRYLRYNKKAWFAKYQMISTTGMNTGVGLGGLVLLAISFLGNTSSFSLGGPVGDGCMVPSNMPQF